MRVKFGPWMPDQPDLDSGGLEECANCMPMDNGGYFPVRSGRNYGVSATLTVSAIAAAFVTVNVNLTTVYASGEGVSNAAPRIQRWTNVSPTWVDVGRTASYVIGMRSFAVFGTTVLATNGVDTMQVSVAGANFRDQSASASAPICDQLCTVRDFVFASGQRSNSATYKTVFWCHINNPLRWGASPRNQSDSQVLPGGGAITAMTGGDFATILTEQSVWRATYVGSPIIFRFDEVSPQTGCQVAGSVARYQNLTFFYSTRGFMMFDGAQVIPIGAGMIDDFAKQQRLDSTAVAMSSTVDITNSLYVICYLAPPDPGFKRVLIYHWPTKRWARINDLGVTWIAKGSPAPSTVTGNMRPGQLDVVAFSSAFVPQVFDSTTLTGTLITGEAQFVPDRRAFVRAVRPLVQASGTSPTVTVQIGKRDRLIDSVSYTTASQLNSNGWCPVRANARYHRLRLDMTASSASSSVSNFATYLTAFGADIEVVPEGRR